MDYQLHRENPKSSLFTKRDTHFFHDGVKTTRFVVSDVELLPHGCGMLCTTYYIDKNPNRAFSLKGTLPFLLMGLKQHGLLSMML